MAKLVVLYNQPKDQEGFEQHYFNVHIPLVQKVPNLAGAEVHRVLQTQNTSEKLYLMAELHFDNPGILAESLAAPEWQAVLGDVVNNLMQYLVKPPVVLVVD